MDVNIKIKIILYVYRKCGLNIRELNKQKQFELELKLPRR